MNNQTGYPHIDKPWMQYYKQKNLNIPDPSTNITEYLKGKNIGREGNIANSYYGNNITYQELFTKADIIAKSFSELGVKKGDVVMNLLPNIPEAGMIWLGCAQIGAIADFIDPRPDTMDLKANALKVLELIKHEKAKYLVALDICYLGMLKPIENELKELGIENIIIVSASDSMNLKGKLSYLKDVINYNKLRNQKISDETIKKLKNVEVLINKINMMKKQEKDLNEAFKSSKLKLIKLTNLMKECENSYFKKEIDPDNITYLGHTSGTSGSRPKPITLTNKNGISTIEQLIKGNVGFQPKESALHMLPFFAPFGAYDNYLLNLACGSTNIDVPEFEMNEFGYLLKKYHPNIIVAPPAWIAALPDYDYLKKEDLSYLTRIIYGGDAMTPQDEIKLNSWLRKHGSKAEVEKGHGMSEFCGCGSYAKDEYNILGSIGIPLPNTIYTIVDSNIDDHLVPLKFSEGQDRLVGELVVSSDAVTNGKLGDEVIVPHFELDGKSYIRTRDLVEMDRNGIFYHQARKDRSFTRFDGYKIKPHEIESTILESPDVKYAALTEYFDEEKRGIMPICHLVLTEENLTDEEELTIIKNIVNQNFIGNPTMSSRQIPAKFRIREALPITKNSKVDYNALKQEGLDGTEINVKINETNLTVDTINIYKEKSKVKRK